jgi:hypothetical protein
MAVVADFILPGLSTEDYDRIRAAVNWLDNPPEQRGTDHCHLTVRPRLAPTGGLRTPG